MDESMPTYQILKQNGGIEMNEKIDSWILDPGNQRIALAVHGADAVAAYIYERVLEPLGW